MSQIPALVVLLSLQSANVVDVDKAVEEAQQRVNDAQRQIEQTVEQSKKLRQTVGASIADGNIKPGAPALPPTPYLVKPAYHHNWKKDPKYRTHRDYDIYLDYSNQDHVTLIQAQFQEWLKRGYYVVQSESKKIDSDKVTGTIQKIRIVK